MLRQLSKLPYLSCNGAAVALQRFNNARPATLACWYTSTREPETEICRQLKSRMTLKGGPLSVADYMQEVLTHPVHGFYMQNDVFGRKGDFITSPEVSQMFGEMIGIWSVACWMQLGSPQQIRLVELGPGRGTLMADLLRGVAAFPEFVNTLNVHLVEVSPALRQLQWKALRCSQDPESTSPSHSPTSSNDSTMPHAGMVGSIVSGPGEVGSTISGPGVVGSTIPGTSIVGSTVPGAGDLGGTGSGIGLPSSTSGDERHLRGQVGIAGQGNQELAAGLCGITGVQVRWHHSLDAVPSDLPTIYICHEFIDALPVHQFVKDSKRGWLEKLVSEAEDGDEGSQHFKFVLSPRPTPASALLVNQRLRALPASERDTLDAIEVGIHGMAVAERLAVRIGKHGGAALIVDYGKDGPYKDSLMAIKQHKGLKVLAQPGQADLSTWVDFSALRQAAQESGAAVSVHGPVSQRQLLLSCGMEARLKALKQVASSKQAEDLQAQFERLTVSGPEGMGSTYQAMAIFPADAGVPLGFAAES